MQSKTLGIRIAALLHAREQEAEASGKTNGANADLAHLDFSPLDADKSSKQGHVEGIPKPKRRHKIIIHSSPYLRCIQTSTAIAAGISQFQPPAASNLKVPHPKDRNGLVGHSPLSRTPDSHAPVQPISVLEPAADPNLEVFPKKHIGPDKILLRIDAFLGEWLSPDYFEDITPPPNSTMMVAGAKADLLRRGEYVEVQHNVHNSQGHFPGGWVKSPGPSAATSRRNTQDGGFHTMGSLAQALPHRERASSQGSVSSHSSRTSHRGTSALSTAHNVPDHIYDPPVPSYAVSPADPIPRGYVAHARDACIEVDFQWDSMRLPQEWGDGGEYGDEWSTMHKRFRKGLAGMMAWYKEHGATASKDKYPGFIYSPSRETGHHASDPGPIKDNVVEEDEDVVLILVTHGAGCNALLGAISNQPVLLDVGMASLSMAVRREEPRKPSITALPTTRRPSVVDVGMSNEYEMKMLASVDHLRPGVDPTKLPQPYSPAIVSSPSLEYRRRFTGSNTTNSPIDSPFTLGDPWKPINSALGSMRRSSSSGSSSRYLSNNLGGSTSPSMGLWSGLRPPTRENSSEGRRSPGHDMVLNFREHKPADTNNTKDNTINGSAASTNGDNNADKKEENDDVPPLPSSLGRNNSQISHGLWGPKQKTTSNGLWGPPKWEELAEREKGHKRRWTVSERDETFPTVSEL